MTQCPPSTPVIKPLQKSDFSWEEEFTPLDLGVPYLDLSEPVPDDSSPASNDPTDAEISSNDSVFSSASSNGSAASPLSGSQTPDIRTLDLRINPVALSESVTPVDEPGTDYWENLDPDQLRLRLFLEAALQGEETIPEWIDLAEALRIYFNNSWYQDRYTLEFCERNKEFLFWNAVADEKWRTTNRGY